MSVEVFGVYRRTVRYILSHSSGKTSECKRAWLVLRIGGKLEAVAISAKNFRALRREGVPLKQQAVHALRKAES